MSEISEKDTYDPTVMLCPSCGQVHNPADFASLPVSCQVLMYVNNIKDKFGKPTPAPLG